MLFTVTTTHHPATDLGYLLAKNPWRTQSFELSFGAAHVFYPEATEARCTAALLVDIDPIALVRGGRRGNDGKALAPYVNDRPYVLSSHFSTALSRVFGSALNGTCRDRPALAEQAIPLEATLAVVPARGGAGLIRRLFEPLGYAVEVEQHPLDERFEAWGGSPSHTVTLRHTITLAALLRHVYVLVPVLDADKHYWVGQAEIDKLIAKGDDWLADHPAKELIAHRYLARQRYLSREALRRLAEGDDDPDAEAVAHDEGEEAIEKPVRLDDARRAAVIEALEATGTTSVIDLGCGEGKLLRALMKRRVFERIVGVDVSTVALERAAERLRLAELSPKQRARIELLHGSLTYRDARFAGFDAACAIEVIEHLEPDRIGAFEQVLFGAARPPRVVITTPNVEYNAHFGLAPGQRRHGDHRFEWTRAEFRAWAEGVCGRFGYSVELSGIGAVDEADGAPTQMAVFARGEEGAA